MKTMNICIFAPENSPSLGGVGSYVYNLATKLPSSQEVHILTIKRDIDDAYGKIIKKENIHIHNLVKIQEKDYFFYNARLQFALLRKIKEYHKKYNFDVIHSHSGHLPHIFSQFQDVAPLVVTIHATVKGMRTNISDCKNIQADTEKYMGFFSRIIEQGEKISFRKADFFLPVSQFTLQEIPTLYHMDISNKSEVVYNATDIDLFKPRDMERSSKPVITFIGRFYAIKGFDKYLHALLQLHVQGYQFIPLLVGRGKTEQIKQLLHQHFSEYILKDFVPYLKIHEVYDQSDIIVVPSLYENFPGVVLEAMSSGKVVIASNVGGIPEVIEHGKNGFLFEKNNPTDLMEKIKAVLDGTYDIKQIQENARKTIIEHFDWSKKSERINQIYKEIIS